MSSFPWSPPLNENDRLVCEGLKPPFLFLSEWVCMAKHRVTKGIAAAERLYEAGMLDDAQIEEQRNSVVLAKKLLDDHAHLFPEMDENGGCTVEGRLKDGPINREPPVVSTCGCEGDYCTNPTCDWPDPVSTAG